MEKTLQMAGGKKSTEKKNRVTKLHGMYTRCWLQKCHSDNMFLQ